MRPLTKVDGNLNMQTAMSLIRLARNPDDLRVVVQRIWNGGYIIGVADGIKQKQDMPED